MHNIRDAVGVTLQRVARDAGCSTQHLCDIEHGRRGCTLERAARLAAALNQEPETFVERLLQGWLDDAGLAMRVHIEPARSVASQDALAAREQDVRVWADEGGEKR